MVRVLFEISLPEATLARIRSTLEPGALPEGVSGRLEIVGRSGGCESPARGGEAHWTPCWISLEADQTRQGDLAGALGPLKEALVRAAVTGGLDLFAVPATAQIGDGFHRFRDLLDVAERLR